MLVYHHPSAVRHDPGVLSPDHPDRPERVTAIAALGGAGEAESIAPDVIVTPRVASHFGHDWVL